VGEVDGKRIVVTGASRGLGRAFAVALASEGAQLVVNGTNEELLRDVVEEISSAGGSAVHVVGSVADDDLAEALVQACVDSFGGIDAVVNNAGIVRDRTLMNMSPDEFDEVVAVNLRGTWSVSRHAARAMRETGGLLLQVVSNAAFVGSVGQTNYAASKAGVMGMLYSWDVELRRFDIRTNALWPIAQTDMTQVVFDNAAKRAADAGNPPPAADELGFGTTESVAPIVVYLCSDRAAHLRSQLLTFNGSKLGLWSHPHEAVLDRRSGWTVDELAAALQGAAEPVHVVQY
jgi:3-oxoacyl-[acyl-carrier protein] reductase